MAAAAYVKETEEALELDGTIMYLSNSPYGIHVKENLGEVIQALEEVTEIEAPGLLRWTLSTQ